MLRTTRALSAMLTLGALACALDRDGGQPGAPDANVADSTDREDGDAGGTASDGYPDGLELDDGAMNDTGVTTGDASTDSPAPIDSSPTTDSTADGIVDASGAQDGRFDCGANNGMMFTPPGAASAHCYWVGAIAGNWLGAHNICLSQRGHLVTLGSSAETTFVLSLVPTFTPTDRLWIGATDGRFSSDGPGSGPFVWITGEPMTYQNWTSSGPAQQPDGACKTCTGVPCDCEHRVAMMNDGRWEDLYEAIYYRFVCESEL